MSLNNKIGKPSGIFTARYRHRTRMDTVKYEEYNDYDNNTVVDVYKDINDIIVTMLPNDYRAYAKKKINKNVYKNKRYTEEQLNFLNSYNL